MCHEKLNFENAKYWLKGNLKVYNHGGTIEEKISEYFNDKEAAVQKELYWKSIFKQYENEVNNCHVHIYNLEESRAAKARAKAWKPIDYEELRIDPYQLQVKQRDTKIIITYLETNSYGIQNITTEIEEFNGQHLSYALKRIEELNEITSKHIFVKESGTDKRIINIELKNSLSWGGDSLHIR
ncbi:hypothetical protein ACQKD9_26655 [Bacillus paramycoides]|uniref:hypothetical protein n=1 Tax=Bacillus paramycoides TaxID=2026194 RepID=UPI003D08245D